METYKFDPTVMKRVKYDLCPLTIIGVLLMWVSNQCQPKSDEQLCECVVMANWSMKKIAQREIAIHQLILPMP